MQTFIDRIDIFPERREDGNWIKNISFKFYVPIIKEGKAPENIKGITLDKEDNKGDLVPLEKLMTLETVVCLSQQKPDDYIEIEIDLDEIDATSAETKATYKKIQNWVQEHHGFHVTNLNIAQVKQKHGIIERENYNKAKSAYSKQPGCPEEKVKAIEDAMRHFQMIPVVQA